MQHHDETRRDVVREQKKTLTTRLPTLFEFHGKDQVPCCSVSKNDMVFFEQLKLVCDDKSVSVHKVVSTSQRVWCTCQVSAVPVSLKV